MESFLKDLPVHNTDNFSLYSVDNARNMKRPSIYLPTVDLPSEQSRSKNNTFLVSCVQVQDCMFRIFLIIQNEFFF